jgi:heptosyltransferase-2
MRKQGFQQAIVLPNSFKSALIPFYAGIPERTAWVGEFRWPLLNDARRLNKNVFAGMVERFVALAYPASPEPPADCPNPRLLVNEESQTKAVGQFDLDGEGPVLGICPGAEFGPAKQWPAEHYAELANSLLGEGWRVWFFGSISDQLVTESIMADIEPAHFDRCANLVGKTTLGQAIDLLACSRVVASNDSGLMHVAAALGKPIVAMYGSTSSDFTPPLADRVKLLSTDIECRPCFKRECPYGHLRCLNELNPGLAIDAVAELIDTAPQN